MTDQTNGKLPISFWVISIAALIWNLMGVYAYLSTVYMSDEAFAQMPAEQQKLMEALPGWVTGAFAIAVFAGALGCIALLLRKSLATPLLILSFLGIAIQQFYNFFIAKMHTVMGGTSVILPILLLVIGAILIWLSRKWTSKGWLK
jgi:hypothetical protein